MTSISIIISGPPAVGKTTLANRLAKSLDMKAVSGGEALIEIAKERGYNVTHIEGWWDTEEGMRFLKERASDSEIDRSVDKKLISMVMQGGVVVTSYPIPWLIDVGIKIWLKASVDTRAGRMAKRDKIPIGKAIEIIMARDKANMELYRSIYGIGFGQNLDVFDLVVNTNQIGENSLLKTVESYVRGWLSR